MVERHVIFVDGLPYYQRSTYPLGKWREALYVHPETGILCIAKKLPKTPSKKPDNLVVIDKYKEYRKIDDLWYFVTLEITVYGGINQSLKLKTLHLEVRQVDGNICIVHKRQCNKKEIKWIRKQLGQ
ncbi:hypothetical protein NIES4071_68850 [Calothrix sp. NIES-4071]|nr:hypothetical protein NIES4071_68850 [Calothrix sp. NIES-4071]BAZ61163.1 hypothetical protein NIES4105_68810 [Calothrix sp. NIES-4105]